MSMHTLLRWLAAPHPIHHVTPPQYVGEYDACIESMFESTTDDPETVPAALPRLPMCMGGCQQGRWSCPMPAMCAGRTGTPYVPARPSRADLRFAAAMRAAGVVLTLLLGTAIWLLVMSSR